VQHFEHADAVELVGVLDKEQSGKVHRDIVHVVNARELAFFECPRCNRLCHIPRTKECFAVEPHVSADTPVEFMAQLYPHHVRESNSIVLHCGYTKCNLYANAAQGDVGLFASHAFPYKPVDVIACTEDKTEADEEVYDAVLNPKRAKLDAQNVVDVMYNHKAKVDRAKVQDMDEWPLKPLIQIMGGEKKPQEEEEEEVEEEEDEDKDAEDEEDKVHVEAVGAFAEAGYAFTRLPRLFAAARLFAWHTRRIPIHIIANQRLYPGKMSSNPNDVFKRTVAWSELRRNAVGKAAVEMRDRVYELHTVREITGCVPFSLFRSVHVELFPREVLRSGVIEGNAGKLKDLAVRYAQEDKGALVSFRANWLPGIGLHSDNLSREIRAGSAVQRLMRSFAWECEFEAFRDALEVRLRQHAGGKVSLAKCMGIYRGASGGATTGRSSVEIVPSLRQLEDDAEETLFQTVNDVPPDSVSAAVDFTEATAAEQQQQQHPPPALGTFMEQVHEVVDELVDLHTIHDNPDQLRSLLAGMRV
jgi:hypothetical protein